MAARKKITRKAAKPATAKTKPASANRKSKAAAAARGVTKTVAKKASAEKSVTSKSASAKAVGAKAVAAKAPKSKAASGKAAEGASTLKSAEKKIQGAHRAAATEVPTPVAEPVKSVSKPSASIKVDAIKVTSLRGETPKSEASRSALVNAEAVKQEPLKAESAKVAAPGVASAEPAMKSSAPISSARSHVAQKPLRAPAPMAAKMTETEEPGGDQKTMKNSANRHGFKLNEFVVYPAHGVGQIVSVEEQEVAGFKLELFVINFSKDKMTLRVPTSKVAGVGMRKLSEPDVARRSLEILTGRARGKRTMWSRRAQAYEAKINSGDINAIAEVVRDLFRSEAQPEQSYSERQLYEAALDRMMREIAAVHKLTDTEALKMIDAQLKKNAKRAPKAETAEGDDADVEEAA